LSEKLPDYMIPWPIVFMESLPATKSGKRDRNRLPAPDPKLYSVSDDSVEPDDEIEKHLCLIWSECLKVSSVGVNQNFFQLGGHSLLAIKLLSAVKRQLAVTISLGEVLQSPTVRSMATLVRKKQNQTVGWSPLVVLQPRGRRAPLFCAPVGGGSVFYYGRLANAAALHEQPVYGFEPRGMSPDRQNHEAIEDMASYYIEHMKLVQKHGPYNISGLSFGGVVAFEMARQLAAGGDEIGALILIDSHAPAYHLAHDAAINNSHLKVVHKLCYKIALYKEGVLVRESLNERVKLKRKVTEERKDVLPEVFSSIKTSEAKAMRNYQPAHYEGPVHLLRARQQMPGFKIDPYLGWRDLSTNLQVTVTPGTHHTITEEPCVHITMRHIMKVLDGS
jgi:thioesterase domain-containing protein/acyl carrier protein